MSEPGTPGKRPSGPEGAGEPGEPQAAPEGSGPGEGQPLAAGGRPDQVAAAEQQTAPEDGGRGEAQPGEPQAAPEGAGEPGEPLPGEPQAAPEGSEPGEGQPESGGSQAAPEEPRASAAGEQPDVLHPPQLGFSHPQQAYPQQPYPLQPHPQQPYPHQGYPHQGYAQQAPQGHAAQGRPYGQQVYPPWQPPAPPKKASPVAAILIIGSIVVVLAMVAAFLAWGSPGFLREPDVRGEAGASTGTSPASPTSTYDTVPTATLAPPGARVAPPTRATPLADPLTCAFTPTPASPAPKKVNPPPDGPAPSSGSVPVTLSTTAGDIGLTLDRALAPCTVASFLSLARQGFYDGLSCHRLSVVPVLQVLQCGDPSGDGTGGPGYTIKDEVLPELTYGRGLLAMANTGQPDSGGSQFFMVYGDTQIPPDYTVFGSVSDAGLQVLDTVAAGGVDPTKPGPGDGSGPPRIPVTFTHVTTP